MLAPVTSPPALPPLHVACLCAAWCRLCDGYAAVFEPVLNALQREHPRLHWHWLDIEDEAELLGDFDVETFPTVVACSAEGVHFAGPLEPHAATLRRTVQAALEASAPPPPAAPEAQAFATRLLERG